MQAEIALIAKTSDQTARRKAAKALLRFHDAQTKNFQHERAIHLSVTFFFAVLMFASWFGLCAAWLKFANDWLLLGCIGLIVLILTILEFCYIAHYYRLENRTQKLYDLTREIYNLMR